MPLNYDVDSFAADYADARAKFLAACRDKPGYLQSLQHPDCQFDNQPLYTDLFLTGAEKASKMLVVISGTHGVEGFCGSAAQVNWLRHEPLASDDVALLFIHALNPFGFANLRRVNEDNVDLNRNFVDFNKVPDNIGYRQFATHLLPSRWLPDTATETGRRMADYRLEYGQNKLDEAISAGQYHYPDGLFYGGNKPSWSHQAIQTIISDFDIAGRKRAAVIDIHSGLGPYGYGEIICDHPPQSAGVGFAKQWFGDSVTEPALGTSTSVPKYGLMDYAWHRALTDRGCYVTLEFGTYPSWQMIPVLQEENYCWQKPVSAARKLSVQRQLRDYFFPDKQDWKQMVLFRSVQVLTQAINGLCR